MHEQLCFGHTINFCLHNHPHSTIAKILHILEEVFGNLPAGANVSGELADAEWNHFNAVDASSLQRNNLGEKQLHGTLQIARLGNPKGSNHRKTDFMMRTDARERKKQLEH